MFLGMGREVKLAKNANFYSEKSSLNESYQPDSNLQRKPIENMCLHRKRMNGQIWPPKNESRKNGWGPPSGAGDPFMENVEVYSVCIYHRNRGLRGPAGKIIPAPNNNEKIKSERILLQKLLGTRETGD